MARLGFPRPLLVGLATVAMVGGCASPATPQPSWTVSDYWACEHEVSGLQNSYDALFDALVEDPVVGSRAAVDDLIAALHPDAYRYHDKAEGQRLLDRLTEFSTRLAAPLTETELDTLWNEVRELQFGDLFHYISSPCTDIFHSVATARSELPDPPFSSQAPPAVSGGQTTFDVGETVSLLVAGVPWADVTISNPSFDACPDAPRPVDVSPAGDAGCLTVDVRIAAHADGVLFYDDEFPAGPQLSTRAKDKIVPLQDAIFRGYWSYHPDDWETLPGAPWSVAPGSEMAMTWHYGVMPNDGRIVVRYAPVTSCEGECFNTFENTHRYADPPIFEFVLRAPPVPSSTMAPSASPAAASPAALPVQPHVAATIPVGHEPSGVTVAPSGVWVTNSSDNSLSRIDPATNAVLQTLPIELAANAGLEAIAYGDGSLWLTVIAFDAHNGDLAAGSVLRIDPASAQVQSVIAVGRDPLDVEVTPTAVWVPAYADNTLTRIDPATNQLVTTIPVCTAPVGVTSGFGAVWVSCEDGSVERIDPTTNAVVSTIRTQTNTAQTGGAFIVASDSAIWMTNAGREQSPNSSVTRIDPATNAVAARVVVGSYPEAVAYAGGSLWIGLHGAPTVVRVSATTNAVLARITVAAPVRAIAATDRSVWGIHDLIGADGVVLPGTLTRIDYLGVTQGPLASTPPVVPTPSPTVAPSLTTSPSAGGMLVTSQYFSLALPPGWSVNPPQSGDDPNAMSFRSPGTASMGVHSLPSSLTLEGQSAQFIANFIGKLGADPERTEAITLGGAAGQMLTYHNLEKLIGVSYHILAALCVHNGRAYSVILVDHAGNESADRALFLDVVASFRFRAAG